MAEPARPTAEQEEWLKAEGFREEPEEQPDEDGEDGPPKVRQQPWSHYNITPLCLAVPHSWHAKFGAELRPRRHIGALICRSTSGSLNHFYEVADTL